MNKIIWTNEVSQKNKYQRINMFNSILKKQTSSVAESDDNFITKLTIYFLIPGEKVNKVIESRESTWRQYEYITIYV